jgi:hypothetical protein
MFDLLFFKLLLSCFIKYSVKKTFVDFYKNKLKDILASAQRKKNFDSNVNRNPAFAIKLMLLIIEIQII